MIPGAIAIGCGLVVSIMFGVSCAFVLCQVIRAKWRGGLTFKTW